MKSYSFVFLRKDEPRSYDGMKAIWVPDNHTVYSCPNCERTFIMFEPGATEVKCYACQNVYRIIDNGEAR